MQFPYTEPGTETFHVADCGGMAGTGYQFYWCSHSWSRVARESVKYLTNTKKVVVPEGTLVSDSVWEVPYGK